MSRQEEDKMKKDIYCITNQINGMQYIGQSKDANKRFKAHLRATDGTLLHQAILQYGKDNFSMEILVPQTEFFNELEQYWIIKNNTLYPFGYNMTKGGEGYPHQNGELCYQAKLNNSQVKEIINLLKNTDKNQTEIGELFNVNQSIISNINLGNTYYQLNEKYPIRSKVEELEKNFQKVKNLLVNTQLSFNEIAQQTGINKSMINGINQGYDYFHEKEDYPLRKVPNTSKLGKEEILLIIKKLLEENILSMQEIAEMFGVQRNAISHINLGKSHYHEDWNYPLRKENKKNNRCISETILLKIIEDLKNTNKSFRQIARENNISNHSIIQGINSGTTKTYYRSDIEYPIRKK